MPRRRQGSRQDQPCRRRALRRTPRSGREPIVWVGDVLVTACIFPISSSQRIEPAPSGRLRTLDQTMEARELADLFVCRAGAESARIVVIEQPPLGGGTTQSL